MDELQAGVESALAILPQPPVSLQARKAALDDPGLGHDFKRVQRASLGDLHRHMLTQDVLDALQRARLYRHYPSTRFALGPASICSARMPLALLCDKSLRLLLLPRYGICEVPLDARDIFAGVIAL